MAEEGGGRGCTRPSEGFRPGVGGELRMKIKRDEQMRVGGMEGVEGGEQSGEWSRAQSRWGGNQQRSLHTGPNNEGQPG